MSADNVKGACLCGTVTISAAVPSRSVGACHCNMCRRWGGGPLFAVECGTEVRVEGDSVSVYDSSEWAERGFCSRCGTHLFYRLKQNQQYFIPAGLLDATEGLVFDQQVFIDEKPGYYDFSNETEKMTGAELFAKFAPE